MSKSHQIGLIIRSCRESRGISQDYMAEMLNIAQSAYAYLESGKTTMSVDRLMQITEILELDIHQILDESMLMQHPARQPAVNQSQIDKSFYQDTKEVYDQLITELRSEIDFLRSLIKKE